MIDTPEWAVSSVHEVRELLGMNQVEFGHLFNINVEEADRLERTNGSILMGDAAWMILHQLQKMEKSYVRRTGLRLRQEAGAISWTYAQYLVLHLIYGDITSYEDDLDNRFSDSALRDDDPKMSESDRRTAKLKLIAGYREKRAQARSLKE